MNEQNGIVHAVAEHHPDFETFLSTANALHATNNLQIIPDFSLKDSLDQTVLGLALWTGKTPDLSA